jgi:choline dehydrogenase
MQDIREHAWSVFHPCATCRMDPDPDAGVVDHRLRVHGMRNLRVVDASIFPSLVSGNTNAAVIMVGEKAADLILAREERP